MKQSRRVDGQKPHPHPSLPTHTHTHMQISDLPLTPRHIASPDAGGWSCAWALPCHAATQHSDRIAES